MSNYPNLSNTPLPPGWEMLFDRATGSPFFVDHTTQSTSWTDPRLFGIPSAPFFTDPLASGFTSVPVDHYANASHAQSQYHAPRPEYASPAPRPEPPRQEQTRYRAPMHYPTHNAPAHQQSPQYNVHPQRARSPGPQRQDYHQPAPEMPVRSETQSETMPPPKATYRAASTVKKSPAPSPKLPRDPSEPSESPKLHHLTPETGSREGSRSSTPTAQMGPLDKIAYILQDLEPWQQRVDRFNGQYKDKEYLLLEEMMTRAVLKLDQIEANGDDQIRQSRKSTVRTIQAALDQMELKAFSNEEPSNNGANEHTECSNGRESDTRQSDDRLVPEEQKEAADQTMKNHSTDEKRTEKKVNGKPNPARVNEMVLDSEVQC